LYQELHTFVNLKKSQFVRDLAPELRTYPATPFIIVDYEKRAETRRTFRSNCIILRFYVSVFIFNTNLTNATCEIYLGTQMGSNNDLSLPINSRILQNKVPLVVNWKGAGLRSSSTHTMLKQLFSPLRRLEEHRVYAWPHLGGGPGHAGPVDVLVLGHHDHELLLIADLLGQNADLLHLLVLALVVGVVLAGLLLQLLLLLQQLQFLRDRKSRRSEDRSPDVFIFISSPQYRVKIKDY